MKLTEQEERNLVSYNFDNVHNGCINVSFKNLTSLEGAPKEVGGNFFCSFNQLTSLKDAPSKVGGSFSCLYNQLTSLEGAPEEINGAFNCHDNKLTSLKDIHKQIKKIDGIFFANTNPIKSHILGLLLIKGITKVKLDNKEVEDIINKYLGIGDIFSAQEELIDAGLEEYAKL
jgi:hypothetical protein